MKKAWLTLSALALCISAGSALAKDYTEIKFGVDPSYAPFESKDASGQLVGFDIDLGNAICKELKVTCTWVEGDFDGLIPSLGSGKIDAALSSLTETPVRAAVIDFSARLFNSPSSLLTLKGSAIKASDLTTLKGKTIGVEQGTIQEKYAKAKLAPLGATVKAYANQDAVYDDLKSGRLDASMQDKLQAELGFLKTADGAKFASADLSDEMLPAEIAIGIKKGNKDLKALIDKGIEAMHKDGTYTTLQKKYFGDLDLYTETK